MVETPTKQDNRLFNDELQMTRQRKETNIKLQEHRKKMMDSVGRDAYNGVNVFENVEPMQHHEPQAGSADLGNPQDSGVDISALVGDASKIWQAIK